MIKQVDLILMNNELIGSFVLTFPHFFVLLYFFG